MDIKLRQWTMDDASALLDVIHHSNTRYLRYPFPQDYTLEDAKNLLKTKLAGRKYNYAIICDGAIVGHIDLHKGDDDYDNSLSMTCYIRADQNGKGIGAIATNMIVNEALTKGDADRVYGYVLSCNDRSMNVMRKCGFRVDRVLEKVWDIDGELVDLTIFVRDK